jgi:hypothetical protein
MRIWTETEDKLIFDVYPPFYYLALSFVLFAYVLWRFPGMALGYQICMGIILGFILIEVLLFYLKPLHIEIDKSNNMLYYRDLHFASIPNLIVKDDVKDEYATYSPSKRFSISGIKKLSFVRGRPGAQQDVVNLFPLRFLTGGVFSFYYEDGEKLDIYVARTNVRKHLQAFTKIAAYLAVPFETPK